MLLFAFIVDHTSKNVLCDVYLQVESDTVTLNDQSGILSLIHRCNKTEDIVHVCSETGVVFLKQECIGGMRDLDTEIYSCPVN